MDTLYLLLILLEVVYGYVVFNLNTLLVVVVVHGYVVFTLNTILEVVHGYVVFTSNTTCGCTWKRCIYSKYYFRLYCTWILLQSTACTSVSLYVVKYPYFV